MGLTFPGSPPPASYPGHGALQRIDLATGEVTAVVEEVGGNPLRAPNDLVVAADGGIWFTDHGARAGRHVRPHRRLLVLARRQRRPRGRLPARRPERHRPVAERRHPVRRRDRTPAGCGRGRWSGPASSAARTRSARAAATSSATRSATLYDSLAVDGDGWICVATLGTRRGITSFSPDGTEVEHMPFPTRSRRTSASAPTAPPTSRCRAPASSSPSTGPARRDACTSRARPRTRWGGEARRAAPGGRREGRASRRCRSRGPRARRAPRRRRCPRSCSIVAAMSSHSRLSSWCGSTHCPGFSVGCTPTSAGGRARMIHPPPASTLLPPRMSPSTFHTASASCEYSSAWAPMMAMPVAWHPVGSTFWVETLGCPKNQVDSDKIDRRPAGRRHGRRRRRRGRRPRRRQHVRLRRGRPPGVGRHDPGPGRPAARRRPPRRHRLPGRAQRRRARRRPARGRRRGRVRRPPCRWRSGASRRAGAATCSTCPGRRRRRRGRT